MVSCAAVDDLAAGRLRRSPGRRHRLGRQLGAADPATDVTAGPLQVGDIARIEPFQDRADFFVQPVVREKIAVRLSGGGESIRHPYALRPQARDHLAKRGIFAPHHGDIRGPKLGESANVVIGHGRHHAFGYNFRRVLSVNPACC